MTATAVLRSAGIHYHRPLGHRNPFARNDNILVDFYQLRAEMACLHQTDVQYSSVLYLQKGRSFFQRERENLGKEPDLKTHLLQVKGSRFKRTHRVALTRKKTTTFASSPDTKHISKSYRKNLSKSHTQDNDTSSPLKYTTHVLLYIYRNVRFICSKYYHAWTWRGLLWVPSILCSSLVVNAGILYFNIVSKKKTKRKKKNMYLS